MAHCEAVKHRVAKPAWAFLLCGLLSACGPAEPKRPDPRQLRLPTATLVDPSGRWLFVTQGNWDRRDDYSLLSTFDMAAIEARWRGDTREDCWEPAGEGRALTCNMESFRLPQASQLLPSGASNIVMDRRSSTPDGRLLIPSRHRSALTWIDLRLDPTGSLRLDCGQQGREVCDAAHILDSLADEPARVYLDQEGFDFAYIPHILDRRLTLIALEGPQGPRVVDEEEAFFDKVQVRERELGGGFGLAQLPCDLAQDFVPQASRDCSRPYLYAAERFVFGFRPFAVAPGRQVILASSSVPLSAHRLEDDPATGWPTMGSMWVRRNAKTPELFVVQHEPPLLLRYSLALDAQGNPNNRFLDAVQLCERADLMQAVNGPLEKPRLLLSCPGRGELWMVEPELMRVSRRIKVGAGANELFYEEGAQRLWVSNTLEHSLSVIDVDPASPSYLRERLVLTLQPPPRD